MQEYTVKSSEKPLIDLNEKIRVLHVDDDPSFLKIAQQCLETEGPLQVNTALSVDEALAKLGKEKYDAVVSDYQMPGKDGLEFLKELRGKGNTIPFIIFTEKGREEIAIKALNLGANQYLNKVGETQTVYAELAHTITESVKAKKSAEKLQESEGRFRSLVEEAGVPIAISDMKGHFTYANKTLAKLLGYSQRELLGRSFRNFLHPKDRGRITRLFLQATILRREPYMIEFRALRSDRRVVHLMSRPTRLIINGETVGFEAIMVDITERKKMEETLRNSEEKLRAIISSSPDAISVYELNGILTDCNKSFLRVHGYSSKAELIGIDGFKIIAERDRPKANATLKKVLDEGHAETVKLGLTKKDGREFAGELSGSLIHDSSGKPTSIVVVTKDLSDHLEAEQTIRENQQRFERLFRENPEAAIYLSPDFRVLEINPRFEQLFGYTIAEVKGKHLDDVIVQKDKMEEAGSLNQRALQGYVYHDTLRRRRDGTLIPVSISAAPITVEGRLEGYVGMYKDISELRNTEEALKETMGKLATINEKLRVVGSLTRHDVRNKLTLVTGNTYLMKKKAAENPEMLEHIRDMEEACKQIVEIFEFAKSYETLGEEELKYVDVADAFDKAASQFIDLKGIKTVNKCRRLAVYADSLLTRLFYNLIDNSLKYGEKITHIRVHHEKSPEQLKLIYEDDGVGIPSAEKPKLFAKGYGKGTGYGLYLIKRLMEAYGWTIEETGEPGKGAQFTIKIPRTNQKAKENYRVA